MKGLLTQRESPCKAESGKGGDHCPRPRRYRYGSACLNASDISRALASRIDDLVQTLFPCARREGPRYRIGSLDGEAGQSLCIKRSDGHWQDFATGEYGDALDLVCGALRRDMRAALDWSRDWLGIPAARLREHARTSVATTATARTDTAERIARARAIWKASRPIVGTLGDIYLRETRCINVAQWPATVRFHPRLRYSRELDLPAIVVPVQKASGAFCGIWRTYLNPKTAHKANVDNPRLGLGDIRGGSVRLTPIADEMVIGEGLETCLSVLAADPSRAVLMALSASFLRCLELPPVVRHVVLLEENDGPDQHGRRASEDACAELAQRLINEGRSVSIAHTPTGFKDLNDILRSRPMGAADAA